MLFKLPTEIKFEKNIYNPKKFKHIARKNFKLDDKQLSKQSAKKMINPYSFTDRAQKVRFNNTLKSYQNNHANSKLIINTNFPEYAYQFRYTNEILKEMDIIYAR